MQTCSNYVWIVRVMLALLFVITITACESFDPPASVSPQILAPEYDQSLEGKTTRRFYVLDSVPVNSGTPFTIYDFESKEVLVAVVVASNVSWKVDNPFSKPSYPAFGSITVALTDEEWEVVEKSDAPAVRPIETAPE